MELYPPSKELNAYCVLLLVEGNTATANEKNIGYICSNNSNDGNIAAEQFESLNNSLRNFTQ